MICRSLCDQWSLNQHAIPADCQACITFLQNAILFFHFAILYVFTHLIHVACCTIVVCAFMACNIFYKKKAQKEVGKKSNIAATTDLVSLPHCHSQQEPAQTQFAYCHAIPRLFTPLACTLACSTDCTIAATDRVKTDMPWIKLQIWRWSCMESA